MKTNLRLLLLGVALMCYACSTGSNDSPGISNDKPLQYSSSTGGMAASAQPLATQVGKEILAKGGNAADAAVAMSFTLAVVEPAMSGLGGRMQVIVRTDDGKIHGIDATTQAPMTYDQATAPQAKYGYAVIGVPGVVAGAAKLNKQYGSMPLAQLMAPAIEIARNGFHQLPEQAALQASVVKQLMEFEGSKQYFIKPNDSTIYGHDDLLVQKDLAHTLQLIADQGPSVFYEGEIAKKIVEDVAAHGGALTLESLADYEAMDSEIMTGSYRGVTLHGLWMPSFGAITIEILQILENLPMESLSQGERASAIYQAIKLAYVDRFRQSSLEVGQQLVDPEYAKEQAAKIIIGTEDSATAVIPYQDPYLAWAANPGHTTHMAVADKDGMIVSLTQSLGPIMGSKVATPGLGFLYAATLGGYLGPMEPGQRAASHISPMILTKNGQPYMGIGAAGGSRIPTAIIQVVSRILDQGMSLDQALAAPRVHPSNDGVLIERHDSLAWNSEDLEFLRNNGFIIEEVKEKFRFGRVHAVLFNGNEWEGAADPDGEGSAAGPDK